MRCRSFFILLGISVLAASVRAGDNGEQPYVDGKTYQVPIEHSEYNLIFTKVSINGKEVLALIDTGSSSPVQISLSLAQKLKIPLADDKMRTTRGLDGRVFPIQTGRVETLKIGDYQKRNVPVQVAGDRVASIAKMVKTPFEMILGWEFLSEQFFSVDYKKNVLRLSDAVLESDQGGVTVSYSVVNHLPIVKGSFGKEEVSFLFDTGAPMCNIDTEYAQAKPGQVISKEVMIGGRKLITEWRVKDLSATKKSLGNAGTIGNSLLNQHAVYFDIKNSVLHLD